MPKIFHPLLIAGALAMPASPNALAGAMSEEEIIKNATSAAPTAVAANAAVITFDDKMQVKTLREGANGFTCIPDDPRTPTDDPMCVDANGLAFVQAWIARQPPPEGKVGFGYMLKGGSSASKTDPFAAEPAAGQEWSQDGPHVMIFNAKSLAASYPRPAQHPDTTQPYVMWPDTPYEHLMVPVE